MKRAISSFPLLLLVLSSSIAQVSTTSLHGVVSDPGGAVVSGARITLANRAAGFGRTTTSNGRGDYQFLQVPPGTYTLTAEAAGFATVSRVLSCWTNGYPFSISTYAFRHEHEQDGRAVVLEPRRKRECRLQTVCPMCLAPGPLRPAPSVMLIRESPASAIICADLVILEPT
jgi:hypothetical protein